jgi:phosphate transport system substrate-binding protein
MRKNQGIAAVGFLRLGCAMLTLIVLVLHAVGADAAGIFGAGATFPAAVMQKWADAFEHATGKGVNYQPVGSAEGIRLATARAVDFGVSDMPLTSAELTGGGLLQFPIVIGGAVPTANIPGLRPGELRLTGPVLAAIYLGKLERWNHQELRKLNPGLTFPDLPITVVHRADGSGTTFIFTSYLSAVSPEWRERVGAGSSLRWPLGRAGRGNEGVSTIVRSLPGALGYLEYTYAVENGLPFAQLQNKAGRYVSPGEGLFLAAAAAARWSRPSFLEILTDRACPEWAHHRRKLRAHSGAHSEEQPSRRSIELLRLDLSERRPDRFGEPLCACGGRGAHQAHQERLDTPPERTQ